MSAPVNFRSAFNGFNREDVVRYLEYTNAKHTAQINQLTSENEFLRSKLDSAPDSALVISALEQERDELLARLEALEAQQAEAAQESAAEETPVPAATPSIEQELEAYRRAEQTERLARERAELIYHQANSVLADATARVDNVACEIGIQAEQVSRQLSQLQIAVSNSKQALKDAASIMYTIRPDGK